MASPEPHVAGERASRTSSSSNHGVAALGTSTVVADTPSQHQQHQPPSGPSANSVELREMAPPRPTDEDHTQRATTVQQSQRTSPAGTAELPLPSTTNTSSQQSSQPPPDMTSSSSTAPQLPPIDIDGGGTTAARDNEPPALGPATDAPPNAPTASAGTGGGPVVAITLLVPAGTRHPYKIDEKYLRRRNVVVAGMDPFGISVYTLKELIWTDWREEWEPRPSSPHAIRLIHFGRMLDDKHQLRDCRFNADTANVVHMSVKPQEVADDEDPRTAKGSGHRDADGDEATAGCRCACVVL